MAAKMSARGDCIEFGPFRLFAAERRLLNGETPVPIGGRALDILVALVERAGEVVTKRELFARVWPDITVDESSLRVQVAALRKALGDGGEQPRFILNVAGRGYMFVGSYSGGEAPLSRTWITAPPTRPGRIIGRQPDIAAVSDLLTRHRLVTVHGPGGIGKTTLGLAVASLLAPAVDDGVCFVDLSLNADTGAVAHDLASALGLTVRANDPTANIVTFLRSRNLLLVLDGCEAKIDAAAALAEGIVDEAPGVCVLTTSREPLRARGEYVYPLGPLPAPPEDAAHSVTELLNYPAAQLFCERAAEGGYQAEVGDADAVLVGAHLPPGRRQRACARARRQPREHLRPAPDRRTVGQPHATRMARAPHRAAPSPDAQGHARLELRADRGTGARASARVVRVCRPFHL